MEHQNIISLIPQKSPFIMIGELLSADHDVATTSFVVDENNILVDDGTFTEAGLLENMAQTAAAGAGYFASMNNRPVQNGYIAAVKNLSIFSLPKINDRLQTKTTRTGIIFNMHTVEARVWCKDTLIAQCEMKIFLTPQSE